MSRAIIVSNGKIDDYSYYLDKIKPDDYIICADGGIRHLLSIGVTPHIWLGDFDSCHFDELILQHPELKKLERITLKKDKDETDTHYACITAINKGYKNIVIWGAFGGRVDHMISNIHLLEFLKNNNIHAKIENEKNTLQLCNNSVTVSKCRKYLSILPLTSSVVISKTEGLLYPLKNFTLTREISMGVSNEIISDKAYVEISSGLVLIAECDD